MKILLETKDKNEVIKWIISILTDRYEYYTSLFKCGNKEMRDFLNGCIKKTLCDPGYYLTHGFVENIGNTLSYYIFCINCGEGDEKSAYKIIYDENQKANYFIDGWHNWFLFDDYKECLKEACSIFASNAS
jgi:hypothetical protein